MGKQCLRRGSRHRYGLRQVQFSSPRLASKIYSWRGFSAILCLQSALMLVFRQFMLAGSLLLTRAYRHHLRTVKIRLPAQIQRKWMRRVATLRFEIHRPRRVADFLKTRDATRFG